MAIFQGSVTVAGLIANAMQGGRPAWLGQSTTT